MSGWTVIHEPDDDPSRNWADREFGLEDDAVDYEQELDRTCRKCSHTTVWVA